MGITYYWRIDEVGACAMKTGQVWTFTVEALEGAGTADDPHLIYDAQDMQTVGSDPNYWDKHFKLMADIDLGEYTGTSFNMIGYRYIGDSKPFTGVFDGNGRAISNFTYSSPESSYVGIFGYVDNAQIRNVKLVEPNVDAGQGSYVGTLVGYLARGAEIIACSVEGGNVRGRYTVGGLAGANHGTISRCYSARDVSGEEAVGGLVGTNSGTVSDCYSLGTVSGDLRIGGLTGWNFEGDISNCYSTSRVSGDSRTGGLVGSNGSDGSISNSYSAGAVSGGSRRGGLVGFNLGSVDSCFWDIQASGQTRSAGGTGKTREEMKLQATFEGWDFVNVWDIIEYQSYPFLRVFEQ
jgi:hypothetical protein